MLDIVVLVIAVIALISGKFQLGKSRVLRGWRARICGGMLLLHFAITFTIGLAMGMTDSFTEIAAIIVSITSMVLVIGASYVVGSMLYKAQQAESAMTAVTP